jgi:ribosomal protein S18 acetylase RimI-like enzyme
MGYVPEIPADRKFHGKYHDAVVKGLRAPPVLSDSVIWEEGIERITVVNFQSPLVQKKRAERIGSLAHRDTRYDFPPYSSGEALDERNVHVFLGFTANRAMGLFVVERRPHVWRCTWEEYKNETHTLQELRDHAPVWSVGLAWVHRDHRRRGWARRLAEQAAHFFAIDIQAFGWYTPFSEQGEAMVRRLCPAWFYIAK